MDTATGVYSCDDHLDLRAVPPDLWQSRLDRAQSERGPHVVARDDELVWVCEDRVLGGSGLTGKGAVAKKLSAIGHAAASTTTGTAPARRSCGSRTWTATASWRP